MDDYKCPRCKSKNIVISVHFAFCEDCDWATGQEFDEADKATVAAMSRFMREKGRAALQDKEKSKHE